MRKYLALDIGGSKIEAGLVTGSGDVLGSHRVESRPFCTRHQMLADVADALAPFTGERVSGLGVGFPALGNFSRGVVLGGGLFPSMEGFHLRHHLEHVLGAPVRMSTDANLFALGLLKFGEGREYRDFLALTLGTGTGVGVVQGGRLIEGKLGMDERVVRMSKEWGEREYHSGYSMPRVYGADGATLAQRASEGDLKALAAFQAVGQAIAGTIHRLGAELRPEAAILGGGIARSYELFAPAMHHALGDSTVHVSRTRLEHAALLGAPALFREV